MKETLVNIVEGLERTARRVAVPAIAGAGLMLGANALQGQDCDDMRISEFDVIASGDTVHVDASSTLENPAVITTKQGAEYEIVFEDEDFEQQAAACGFKSDVIRAEPFAIQQNEGMFIFQGMYFSALEEGKSLLQSVPFYVKFEEGMTQELVEEMKQDAQKAVKVIKNHYDIDIDVDININVVPEEGWKVNKFFIGGLYAKTSGYEEHFCNTGCVGISTAEGEGPGGIARLVVKNENLDFRLGGDVSNREVTHNTGTEVSIQEDDLSYAVKGGLLIELANRVAAGASADLTKFYSGDPDLLEGLASQESSVTADLGVIFPWITARAGAGLYNLEFVPPFRDEASVDNYSGLVVESAVLMNLMSDKNFSLDAMASFGGIMANNQAYSVTGTRGSAELSGTWFFSDDVGLRLGAKGDYRHLTNDDAAAHPDVSIINDKRMGLYGGIEIRGVNF